MREGLIDDLRDLKEAIERRYNPSQPRDPDGQWSDGIPNLPGSTFTETLHLAGGTATVDRHGGRSRLTIGDRSVSLTSNDREHLRRLVNAAGYGESRSRSDDGVYRLRRGNSAGPAGSETLVSLRHVPGTFVTDDGRVVDTDEVDGHEVYDNEFDMILGEGAGDFADEPSTRVTLADLENILDQLAAADRGPTARQVDTGMGEVGVFTPGKGRLGLRVPTDDGDVDVEFDKADWKKVWDAIHDSLDQRNLQAVDTANGRIEVQTDNPSPQAMGPDAMLFISGLGWSIAAQGDGIKALYQALLANGRAAGIVRSNLLRHLPGRHDQMSHGRPRALAGKLAELIPDDQADDALSLSGGRYFDWGTNEDGGRRFEVGDGDDSAAFDVDAEDLKQIVNSLSVTLLRNTATPPAGDDRQSVLIAALMSVGQRDGVYLGNVDEIDERGRYLDWSSRGDDGSYRLDVGSDDDSVTVPVSPEEMAQLHAQLVRTLLGDESTRARILTDPLLRVLMRFDQTGGAVEVARYSPEQPRVDAGSASGGQFAAADSGGRKKSSGSDTLGYDPKSNRGSGYGVAGGDARVKQLQEALNRLGVTDQSGKPLKVDGKLGPKTTAAIRKLQKQLGVKVDGQVTPELLKRILAMKGARPAAKTTPRTGAVKQKSRLTTKPKATLSDKGSARLQMRGGIVNPTYDRTFPLDDIQIQRSGDGRTVEAYAAMFDAPYEVIDEHGHYKEAIDRSAFNRTLNGAGRTAMCLYNHGRNLEGKPDSMASIPLGNPLEIRPDGRGLLTVTRYNKGPYTDQVLESIRNGDIKAQSFRGRIVRSSPNGRIPRARYGQPLPLVTRHELGLTDYGPTPIAVNNDAEIVAIRSVQDLMQELEELTFDEREELLRSLGLSTHDSDFTGDPDDEDEEEDDLGDEEEEDEPATPAKSGPGAEDPPLKRHSGRQQTDLTRRIRAAMLIRSRK